MQDTWAIDVTDTSGGVEMEVGSIVARVGEVAGSFARERAERQRRRALDPVDFARLAEAGYLLASVPDHLGGAWRGPKRTLRAICEMLRAIAHGDGSVALVA